MLTRKPSSLSRWLYLLMLLVALGPAAAVDVDKSSALAQLVEQACDRDVVVLGELPSHGEARGFQAKAEVVQTLVERCSFNGVFFEAPIYEFLGLEVAIADDDAVPAQLDNAMGGFWMTEGLRPFRHWLFEQASSEGLTLAGLDDQVSATSVYARATLPDLVGASVPPEQRSECEQAMSRNLYWRYTADEPFDGAEQTRLQRCSYLAREHAASLSPSQRQQLDNVANLYARHSGSSGAVDRDAMMYRNFAWHHKRLPEGSKIVVWTATVHAARAQGPLSTKPLGAWLADDWADRLFAVGFSARGGQSSMAGGAIKVLAQTPASSLEVNASDQADHWVLLDRKTLREIGSVPSRLLGSVRSENWSQLFDAVLVIGEELAPIFEKR